MQSRYRYRFSQVTSVIAVQYTSHFKSVKLLNKRTKKHLEASIDSFESTLACSWDSTETSPTSLSTASSSECSLQGAHAQALSVAVSRVFAILVDNSDRSALPENIIAPMAKKVDDPARLKIFHAALGA